MPLAMSSHSKDWLLRMLCIGWSMYGFLRRSSGLRVFPNLACGVLLAMALQWPGRRRSEKCRQHSGVVVHLAKSPVAANAVKALRFKLTVSCLHYQSRADLSKEEKAQTFWQPEDYVEFLRVRILISRAYHAIAKRRGVAVGSAFPTEPMLEHESRLGLCLGHQAKRTQSRKHYVTEVLKEQARQLSLATSPTDGKAHSQGQAAADLLDHELLAQVARCASKCDGACSLEQGMRLHQRVMKDLEGRPRQLPVRRTSCPNAVLRADASPDSDSGGPKPRTQEPEDGRSLPETRPSQRHCNAGPDLDRHGESPFSKPCQAPRHRGWSESALLGLRGAHAPGAGKGALQVPLLPLRTLNANARSYGLTREVLWRAGIAPTGSLLVDRPAPDRTKKRPSARRGVVRASHTDLFSVH